MEIVSLTISLFTLIVTGIPILCHYFDWRRKIVMTVAESKVEIDKIRISLVYVNRGYKQLIISNSFISLSTMNDSNRFTVGNMVASESKFTPIILKGKSNIGVILEYSIPKLSYIDNETKVYIHTHYVCFKGKYLFDRIEIGNLGKNDTIPVFLTLTHESVELKNQESLLSMNGYIEELEKEK